MSNFGWSFFFAITCIIGGFHLYLFELAFSTRFYNVTSDDPVLGRGFISHSPKISCQFATKIRMIRLTFMFTWTKNKIPFCPPLRPDFSKFSFCIFFIFRNHIKNHTTFLQVLATAAENCWNYEARHETSIRSVNMVLSCIILILVANLQGIFG